MEGEETKSSLLQGAGSQSQLALPGRDPGARSHGLTRGQIAEQISTCLRCSSRTSVKWTQRQRRLQFSFASLAAPGWEGALERALLQNPGTARSSARIQLAKLTFHFPPALLPFLVKSPFPLHCKPCIRIRAASLESVSSLPRFESLSTWAKATRGVPRTLTDCPGTGIKLSEGQPIPWELSES